MRINFLSIKWNYHITSLNIAVYTILFLTIYNPGFRFFNSFALSLLISLNVILFNLRSYFQIFTHRHIVAWFVILIITFFWSLGIDIIYGNFGLDDVFTDLSYIRKTFWFENIILFINGLFLFTSLVVLMSKLKWDFEQLLSSFVYISVFSSIVSVAMFVIPPLKDYIMQNVINLDYYFTGENESFETYLYFRLNGIGSELTFGFSLFQGLTLAIIFYKNLYFKSKLIYFFPILVLSILINARIGIVVPLVYLLLNIRKIIFLKVSLLKLFFLAVFLTILFIYILSHKEILEIMELIIKSGFSSDSILPHKNTLFDTHWFFPDSIFGFFFGDGVYVFGNDRIALHSDVGYVNVINYGGILFQFLKMLSYLYLLFIVISKGQVSNGLLYTVVFSMVLLQIKGNVYGLNGLSKAILITVIYQIINGRKIFHT